MRNVTVCINHSLKPASKKCLNESCQKPLCKYCPDYCRKHLPKGSKQFYL